ncbi:hypothetical protein PROFUN_03462 [Planoprotostelium fungivorum]|uniref:Uncharacterized protein n=1 Tax=Planoprotostelium fungivorum TaxID=1890364 RepID=A0A2P6MN67_9EUKA|nr:hypothetical protein PROFUN_03462 [Planoprotostelium fungivorum]
MMNHLTENCWDSMEPGGQTLSDPHHPDSPFHHWGKWGSEPPAYIILTRTDVLIPTLFPTETVVSKFSWLLLHQIGMKSTQQVCYNWGLGQIVTCLLFQQAAVIAIGDILKRMDLELHKQP